jgi:DNA primase
MDISNEIFGLAKQYLNKVRRSGNENIMAICPFHRKADGTEEKNPSFSMSLTKGVYFCHQCHEKGTLRRFLQELGLDANTIKLHYGLLIDEAGKNIPPGERQVQPDSIFTGPPIDEQVLGLFQHDVGYMFPKYAEETLKHFNVGWDGWWKRITFPIRDIKGDLVAVSGRAVYDDQSPRYKVYEDEYLAWHMPARKGWKKRTVLYNMHNLYPEMLLTTGDPRENYILVVEGFKAAMWAWQCGYKNVVALLGSYLSWEHQWMLEALNTRVYLFLDNNGAGRKGMLDAAERLNTSTYIVEYPERLSNRVEAQPDSLEQDEFVQQMTNAPLFHVWRSYQRV